MQNYLALYLMKDLVSKEITVLCQQRSQTRKFGMEKLQRSLCPNHIGYARMRFNKLAFLEDRFRVA